MPCDEQQTDRVDLRQVIQQCLAQGLLLQRFCPGNALWYLRHLGQKESLRLSSCLQRWNYSCIASSDSFCGCWQLGLRYHRQKTRNGRRCFCACVHKTRAHNPHQLSCWSSDKTQSFQLALGVRLVPHSSCHLRPAWTFCCRCQDESHDDLLQSSLELLGSNPNCRAAETDRPNPQSYRLRALPALPQKTDRELLLIKCFSLVCLAITFSFLLMLALL